MSRIFKNPLPKIALIGGATLSSITMFLQHSIEKKMKSTSSYQEAISILRSEEFPKQYLGEPIEEKGVNFLSSTSHGKEGKLRWIMLGVEGPNKRGFLKYWFSSDDEGHHRLLRVELLDIDEENIFNKFIGPQKEP